MSNRLDTRVLTCLALLSVACAGSDVLPTMAGAGGVGGGSPAATSGGPNGGEAGAVGEAAPSVGAAGETNGGEAGAAGEEAASGGIAGETKGGAGGGAAPSERELVSFIDGIVMGGGKCLPRPLPLNGDLSPNCKVIAASATCDCAAAGRADANDAETTAVRAQLQAEGVCGVVGEVACTSFCACEVSEATGASEQDCLNNVTPAATSTGWCYVAPEASVGSAALVSDCPSSEKQTLLFLGDAKPANGETFFLACTGGPVVSTPTASMQALGAPCIAGAEYDPNFGGFNALEVSVDLGSPNCASGICLVNHFQGRASCPYGQPASGNACFVPGSATPVAAQVSPQIVARRAATASVCSCRCAGPGPGRFCSCGNGMQCLQMIDDFGVSGESAYAGSYCVPNGTAFNPTQLATYCNAAAMTPGGPFEFVTGGQRSCRELGQNHGRST